jgi:hypothetical protein
MTHLKIVLDCDSDEYSGGIYCRHIHGKIVRATFHILKIRRNWNLNETNSEKLCESAPKERRN